MQQGRGTRTALLRHLSPRSSAVTYGCTKHATSTFIQNTQRASLLQRYRCLLQPLSYFVLELRRLSRLSMYGSHSWVEHFLCQMMLRRYFGREKNILHRTAATAGVGPMSDLAERLGVSRQPVNAVETEKVRKPVSRSRSQSQGYSTADRINEFRQPASEGDLGRQPRSCFSERLDDYIQRLVCDNHRLPILLIQGIVPYIGRDGFGHHANWEHQPENASACLMCNFSRDPQGIRAVLEKATAAKLLPKG